MGAADAANGILLNSSGITFEGSTANAHETTLSVTDPTVDRSIVFPDAGGTVALLGSLSVASGSGLTYNSGTGEFGTSAIPNGQLANSSVTVGHCHCSWQFCNNNHRPHFGHNHRFNCRRSDDGLAIRDAGIPPELLGSTAEQLVQVPHVHSLSL